ncbi:hypothetical protein [Rhizorhapis suberifaciens]|uniref:Uncharacterized protein n=1 Tax=Rhizorhapis suberifaciens TaxID=13656 RepID=A0A840HS09_9SPHN|nr:hypothetical protein [Rhizorhapis suberifaciens]MBB4640932.1 hypothetical protein [Rhizorhapis suberifaciens]
MAAFLKSELFRNFLGGFALGAVLVFTFGGDEPAQQFRNGPEAAARLDS